MDSALDMLTRIYNETENYDKAEDCISKISAERYNSRIVGMISMLGHKKCFAELKRFFALAEQVKAVAQNNDLNIAVHNPIYFSSISEKIGEKYMSYIYPEKVFLKYDAFFGDDEAYPQFKKTVMS